MRTQARPVCPTSCASCGSRKTSATPRSRASASPGATRRPVSLSLINCGTPPTAVATTGVPTARASRIAFGMPSVSEQFATTSKACIQRATFLSKPGKTTTSLNPSRPMSTSRFERSRPSPSSTIFKSLNSRSKAGAASTKYRCPFSILSRPTAPTSRVFGENPSSIFETSRLQSSAVSTLSSNALCTTRTRGCRKCFELKYSA